jgi:hypothetical protein
MHPFEQYPVTVGRAAGTVGSDHGCAAADRAVPGGVAMFLARRIAVLTSGFVYGA